jgi:hypothetical protein
MKTYWVAVLIGLLGLAAPVQAQTDAIPRTQLTAVGPGAASSDFPITTAITRVTFNANGMEVDFGTKDGPGRWPDGRTPGWDGDLQYSVGFVVRVNDWWYANAPIENWHGRVGATGPLQDQTVICPQMPQNMGQFQCNIFYDRRWDPLQTRRPAPGETIGVYVVSGDARNDAFYGVRERSNIVLVQLPGQGQTAAFDFSGAPPPPPPPLTPPPPPVIIQPPPVVVTPPPPIPPQVPPNSVNDPLLAQIKFLLEQELALQRDTNGKVTDIHAEVKTFAQQFASVMEFAAKYLAAPIAAWITAHQMAKP